MSKRIVAIALAVVASVGLSAAPAQAALVKPAASQSAVSGWEWGTIKAPAGQASTAGWEWGTIR